MANDLAENLARWGAPVFDELGLSVYDIEVTSGRILIAVDHPDGVSLDVIARCTRGLSPVLDEHDPMAGRYTLEVSSPGLERKLRTVAHRRAAIGETVKVKSRDSEGTTHRFDGVITEVDDGVMHLDTATGQVEIPHDEITSARTVFVWPANDKNNATTRKAKP